MIFRTTNRLAALVCVPALILAAVWADTSRPFAVVRGISLHSHVLAIAGRTGRLSRRNDLSRDGKRFSAGSDSVATLSSGSQAWPLHSRGLVLRADASNPAGGSEDWCHTRAPPAA